MNCPNCGNNLAAKGKFCPYCGTAIPEDILIKIESYQEIKDHAKIAEANAMGETNIAREKTARFRVRWLVFLAIIVTVILVGVYLNQQYHIRADKTLARLSEESREREAYFADSKKAHYNEIERLQKIEDEILTDIRNGDYEQALLKANTLHYTTNYSNVTKKEWDAKREGLIAQLNELIEKQKNK